VIANSTVDPPIIFPIVHFLTNQSWNQVNAYESKSPANAYPIVISDIYEPRVDFCAGAAGQYCGFVPAADAGAQCDPEPVYGGVSDPADGMRRRR